MVGSVSGYPCLLQSKREGGKKRKRQKRELHRCGVYCISDTLQIAQSLCVCCVIVLVLLCNRTRGHNPIKRHGHPFFCVLAGIVLCLIAFDYPKRKQQAPRTRLHNPHTHDTKHPHSSNLANTLTG